MSDSDVQQVVQELDGPGPGRTDAGAGESNPGNSAPGGAAEEGDPMNGEEEDGDDEEEDEDNEEEDTEEGEEEEEEVIVVGEEEVVIVVEDDDPAPAPNPSAAATAAAAPSWEGGSGGPSGSQEGTATCTICLEPWGSSGPHRAACLACGHLFGQNCILKWLQQRAKCPQCNARAHAKDVRPIYVSNLTAVDDSEVEAARRDATAAREAREAAERAAKAASKELRELKAELKHLRAAALRAQQPKRPRETIDLTTSPLDATPLPLHATPARAPGPRSAAAVTPTYTQRLGVPSADPAAAFNNRMPLPTSAQAPPFRLSTCISVPTQQSRCFDLSTRTNVVLLTERDANGVFDLRKVSLMAPTQQFRIPLSPHAGMVRDVQLSPDSSKALAASVGRQAPLAVVSVDSQSVIASLPAGCGAWSCAWDPTSDLRVLAGLANGEVAVFDLRRTDMAFATLRPGGSSRHPVHSLRVQSLGGPGGSWQLMAATLGGVHTFMLPEGASAAAWGPSWDLQAEQVLEGIGARAGAQPCVSLAGGPADLSCAVATFRGCSSGREPYHCVMRTAAAAAAAGASQRPDEPTGAVTPPPVALIPSSEGAPSAVPPSPWASSSGAVSATPEAAGGPSAAPRGPQGWRIWGRLGGHGFTSSATMSRTALVPMSGSSSSSPSLTMQQQQQQQQPQQGRLPFFACADEQSKQMWLWDLATGAIAQRFPAHEAHVLDVRCSGGISLGGGGGASSGDSGRLALASLSPRGVRVYFKRSLQ